MSIAQILFAVLAAAGAAIIYRGLTARGTAEEAATDAPLPLLEPDDSAQRENPHPEQAGTMRLLRPVLALVRPLVSARRHARLQGELSRSGVSMTTQEFFLTQISLATLAFLLAYVRFGNILVSLVGLLAYFIPPIYLRRRQARRQRKFENQLSDVIATISNSLKAGHSMSQALGHVAEKGRPPLSEELARVVREISLGIPLDTAMHHANLRIRSKDFDLMVTAIDIHRTVGGNLAEVLDKIADTIRDRVRVAGEVRVLTAQARASGYIITGLPFGVAGILSLVSPGFEKPLFTSPIGWGLVTVGLISISIGYGIIRKITDIHL